MAETLKELYLGAEVSGEGVLNRPGCENLLLYQAQHLYGSYPEEFFEDVPDSTLKARPFLIPNDLCVVDIVTGINRNSDVYGIKVTQLGDRDAFFDHILSPREPVDPLPGLTLVRFGLVSAALQNHVTPISFSVAMRYKSLVPPTRF